MKRTYLSLCALVVAALTAALPANAQAVAQHKVLTLEGAQKVVSAALAAAEADHSHGAVAVVDSGGNLIAVASLDGTFPQAAQVAIGKAHTAAVFRKDTSFFEHAINSGRVTLVAMQNFTPLQGGVLILVDGEVVGAVGVSGTASQQQDE
ncbi:MAG: heme-binding protein, partial [Candidatus Eremiobacteraeota bacterium]|nr:heme-binding protein [Candidatus Eremiobacteraeota bacterium]